MKVKPHMYSLKILRYPPEAEVTHHNVDDGDEDAAESIVPRRSGDFHESIQLHRGDQKRDQ